MVRKRKQGVDLEKIKEAEKKNTVQSRGQGQKLSLWYICVNVVTRSVATRRYYGEKLGYVFRIAAAECCANARWKQRTGCKLVTNFWKLRIPSLVKARLLCDLVPRYGRNERYLVGKYCPCSGGLACTHSASPSFGADLTPLMIKDKVKAVTWRRNCAWCLALSMLSLPLF